MAVPSNDSATVSDSNFTQAITSINHSVELMRQRKQERHQELDEMEENDIQDLQDSALRTIRELTRQFVVQKEVMTKEAKQANVQMEEKVSAYEATIARLEKELAETKRDVSKVQEGRRDLDTIEYDPRDTSKGEEKVAEPDDAPPAYNTRTRKRKALVLAEEDKPIDHAASKVSTASNDADAASVPSIAVEEAPVTKPSQTKKAKLAPASAVEGDFMLEVYRLAPDKRALIKVENKACNVRDMEGKEDLVKMVFSLMHKKRPKVNVPNAVFVFRAENVAAPAGTELYLAGTSEDTFAKRWLAGVSYITRDIKPVIRFYVYSKGIEEWDGDGLVKLDGF